MINPLNRLSIRLRFALLTGLALLLFALAGVSVIRISVSALERVHAERVVETGTVILAQMGTIVSARMEQLARAGQLDPVRAALMAAINPDGSPDPAMRAAASQALRDAFILSERRLFGRAVFDAIEVTDLSGRLVAATDPAVSIGSADTGGSERPPWWRAARRTGRAVIGVEGHPGAFEEAAGLTVAARLETLDGRVIGVARARLSAAWIAREAAAATQLRKPFDIMLTTRDGRLIFSRRPFRFLESIAERPMFRLAQEEGTAFMVETVGGRGRLVTRANNPNAPVIDDLGWSLFISADRDVVLADTIVLRNTMFVVFALILVAASGLTTLLVLSLVRPLSDLHRAARAVADGTLSARVRPRGRDELAELGQAFNTMAARIESNAAELRALAVTDPLTGVLNRRGFSHRAGIEWARCRRHGRPLVALALDIDHFKVVNDTHGHDAGDAVLRAVAGRLLHGLRPSDVVGRLGGEEFAVVLPETAEADALALAERLRQDIAATPCGPASGPPISVTVSIGLAPAEEVADPTRDALERLLTLADQALYAAKRGGRDRVVPASALTTP